MQSACDKNNFYPVVSAIGYVKVRTRVQDGNHLWTQAISHIYIYIYIYKYITCTNILGFTLSNLLHTNIMLLTILF